VIIQEKQPILKRTRMSCALYCFAIAMGGVMLAYYAIATNISLYLDQNKIGGATIAGTVVAFTTVGGMITSLLLVHIEQTFKRYTIPVMLFGMGIAFFMLTFTNNIFVVF